MIRKVALIITTYNRAELLKQCLHSLMKCNIDGITSMYIADDDSSDLQVYDLLKELVLMFRGLFPEKNLQVNSNIKNQGIKQNLTNAIDVALFHNHDTFINLDPDTIVTPDFIPRLLELKKRFPEHIVTGFNSASPRHPILRHANDYLIKKTVGGVNLCFDKQQYETIIQPALLQDKTDWDYAMSAKCTNGIIVAKPSVVQHIGMTSTMGHDYDQDIALDFPGFIPTPTKKPMPRFPRKGMIGNKI